MKPFPSPEELVAKKFFIFPCNAKKEPKVRWPVLSTCETSDITAWEQKFKEGYWGVDCGKSDLLVLDDDRGKKKIAEVSLGYLEFENEPLPETYTVRTPSGGYHYYFRCENGGTTTGTIGKGLDTRGKGGYVVAPGSPGYEVVKDLPIADAPLWLVNLSLKNKERKTITLANDVVYDTDGNVARAIEYLKSAEPAIEGACGDDRTVKVAMRCKDMAISPDKMFELMDKYYNPRCVPEWKPDELMTKIENAFSYGGSPVGCDTPEAIFTEVEVDTPETDHRLLIADAHDLIRRDLSIDYLIDGLIEHKTTGLIFGDSGAGKSFVTLAMALSIAMGTSWMGGQAKQGPVLYFNGEGHVGMNRRIRAWLQKYGFNDIPPYLLGMSQRQISIDEKSVIKLEPEIKRFVDKSGPLAFLGIDTLARHLKREADENSAKDIAGFLNAMDYLKDKYMCTVAAVHHTGKGNKEQSRGSSAIRGALDWEIRVMSGEIKFTKQKDGEIPRPFGFQLETVDLGDNSSSAVPIMCKYDPTHGKIANLKLDEETALNALREAISESGEGYTDADLWGEIYYKAMGVKGKASNDVRSRFKRIKAMFKKQNVARVDDEGRIYDNTLSAVDTDD